MPFCISKCRFCHTVAAKGHYYNKSLSHYCIKIFSNIFTNSIQNELDINFLIIYNK